MAESTHTKILLLSSQAGFHRNLILYLIKEFERLKKEEQALLGWNAKRELAKINYMALFGVTAKQWRDSNPDKQGNIRDYATMLPGFLFTIRTRRVLHCS